MPITPSTTFLNSSPNWLGYVTIPELNKAERDMYPSLAIAAETEFPLRASGTSSGPVFWHLHEMLRAYGRLVVIKDYLPYVKAPTLMDSLECERAVHGAKLHAFCWLWAFARQCRAARVVVKTDHTGSVYLLMVLPLEDLDTKDQKALIDVNRGPDLLMRYSSESTCTGAVVYIQDTRRVARLMSRFPDGRLDLSERHPDKLELLNKLATRQLKLEPQERLSLSFHLVKNWKKLAQAELATHYQAEFK